jgi:hypothetical protein
MIEAAIDVRLPNPKQTVRRGDVVVVKLAGSPWGTQETKEFLIATYDEPDVEAQLKADQSPDNPIPFILYPYAETIDNDPEKIITPSLWVVQLDKLPTNLQTLAVNTTADIAPLVIPDSAWVQLAPKQAGFMLRWKIFFSNVITALRAMVGL